MNYLYDKDDDIYETLEQMASGDVLESSFDFTINFLVHYYKSLVFIEHYSTQNWYKILKDQTKHINELNYDIIQNIDSDIEEISISNSENSLKIPELLIRPIYYDDSDIFDTISELLLVKYNISEQFQCLFANSDLSFPVYSAFLSEPTDRIIYINEFYFCPGPTLVTIDNIAIYYLMKDFNLPKTFEPFITFTSKQLYIYFVSDDKSLLPFMVQYSFTNLPLYSNKITKNDKWVYKISKSTTKKKECLDNLVIAYTAILEKLVDTHECINLISVKKDCIRNISNEIKYINSKDFSLLDNKKTFPKLAYFRSLPINIQQKVIDSIFKCKYGVEYYLNETLDTNTAKTKQFRLKCYDKFLNDVNHILYECINNEIINALCCLAALKMTIPTHDNHKSTIYCFENVPYKAKASEYVIKNYKSTRMSIYDIILSKSTLCDLNNCNRNFIVRVAKPKVTLDTSQFIIELNVNLCRFEEILDGWKINPETYLELYPSIRCTLTDIRKVMMQIHRNTKSVDLIRSIDDFNINLDLILSRELEPLLCVLTIRNILHSINDFGKYVCIRKLISNSTKFILYQIYNTYKNKTNHTECAATIYFAIFGLTNQIKNSFMNLLNDRRIRMLEHKARCNIELLTSVNSEEIKNKVRRSPIDFNFESDNSSSDLSARIQQTEETILRVTMNSKPYTTAKLNGILNMISGILDLPPTRLKQISSEHINLPYSTSCIVEASSTSPNSSCSAPSSEYQNTITDDFEDEDTQNEDEEEEDHEELVDEYIHVENYVSLSPPCNKKSNHYRQSSQPQISPSPINWTYFKTI